MQKDPKTLPKTETQIGIKVQSLLDVIARLRGPGGCPWDQEQTHLSLTQYAIEETFELIEALEAENDVKIREELGDVLFQVVLHAQLAAERKAFDFADIVAELTEKMIRRHPHVFADVKVQNAQEVIANWEVIKKQEKNTETAPGLNVPPGLPALQRAYKIGKRTEKLQFDWENAEQVWEKVQEENQELREALDEQSLAEIEHEIGDVLFSVAQLARHLKLEPELALRKANRRFENRFVKMKEIVSSEGRDFETLSNDAKESYWQKAKKSLAASE